MKIVVFKESIQGERRVALVPDTVGRLVKKGHWVAIQKKAGIGAGFLDSNYEKAGAQVEENPSGDVLVAIHPPQISHLQEKITTISLLSPPSHLDLLKAMAQKQVTAVALDWLPRTTLAQGMDVLSSQANLAGYWAVLAAASRLPRLFPMLMTAAGTITPAKVLVLGAGVAGLQAVATARRLGAVVEVFDVRKAVKEQILSLGAKFVEVEGEDAATAGGYAKETSLEYQKKQKELIAKHIAKSNGVITTALIPGKRAPILITADMVSQMKPGSVIVDLAAEQEGNTEGLEVGSEVIKNGVTLVGFVNVPSFVAEHASLLFSKNIENFLNYFSKEGNLNLDLNDEIAKGCVVMVNGETVHERMKHV